MWHYWTGHYPALVHKIIKGNCDYLVGHKIERKWMDPTDKKSVRTKLKSTAPSITWI